MSFKRTINVTVGNNLNAGKHGGKNVNARVKFKSPNLRETYETPEIPGGQGYGPFQLEFDKEEADLTLGAGANQYGEAQDVFTKVPQGAVALSVDLQPANNGKIDIQYTYA